MPEWIKEIIIAIGGGTTVAVAILAIFQSIIVKMIDKAIDTSFEKSTIKLTNKLEKSTIKLTNKLERSTRAYDVLLKKEFDYYEKVDPYMATLVPLVQDLEYWSTECNKDDLEYAKEKYREQLLKYLQIISKIKNDVVMFQPYIPTNVFKSISALVETMQYDLQYLKYVGEVLYEKNSGDIDVNKMQEIREKVLMAVAHVEYRIKNRLTELSSN